MEKQDLKKSLLEDYLQTNAQVFFNFVAEGALPEGRGLMCYLYDEEAVDYCLDNPNKWVLYLAVIVRPEVMGEFDPYLSFSPGIMRYKCPDPNDNTNGEWEAKYLLDFFGK